MIKIIIRERNAVASDLVKKLQDMDRNVLRKKIEIKMIIAKNAIAIRQEWFSLFDTTEPSV